LDRNKNKNLIKLIFVTIPPISDSELPPALAGGKGMNIKLALAKGCDFG
jgi:hypothetical protein